MSKVNLSEVDLSGKITVLCHTDDIEVVNDRADILEITPQMTLEMAAKFTTQTWGLAKQDADFKRRLALIYPDTNIVTDPRALPEYPIAFNHVVGLIICTNMALNTNRSPYWKFPETYLHPSSQSRLSDLMTSYTNDADAVQE